MENVQKKRALPMKTKINDIPIKKISKVKLTREVKNRKLHIMHLHIRNSDEYRINNLLRNRQWYANPRNREIKNVRQRLKRYKIKLETQLTNIWKTRGFI